LFAVCSLHCLSVLLIYRLQLEVVRNAEDSAFSHFSASSVRTPNLRHFATKRKS
jgi:hypothetical protein